MKKVLYSYFYKINRLTNKLDILFQKKKAYGILCTENYALYYVEGELCKRGITQNNVSETWKLERGKSVSVEVIGELLRVKTSANEQEKKFFWQWGQTDFQKLRVKSRD